MSSLAVALPLQIDSSTGFRTIKTLKRLFKQNLKMIVLTNPGERVMEPKFGVGVQTFLFENFGHDTMAKIDNKIREQVGIYLPAVQIQEITFGATDPDNNYLGIQIRYSIPGVGVSDFLELTT